MDIETKLSSEQRKKYITIRRRFHEPVVGITGNLGKTSTLSMIRTLLESRGKVLYSKRKNGNWKNNLFLLDEMDSEYNYALFEFDYKRGNDFAALLRLIKPTIGIVTNIGDAHLNYLKDAIRVAMEKTSLVKYLASDGLAILNKDDEVSMTVAETISTGNIVTFGLNQKADYFATDIEQLGPNGMSLKLNGKSKIQLPIYSIHDVYNFLAATACAQNLGFHLSEIIDIFSNNFQLAPGHGRLHKIGDYYLLDESDTATPRSLSKAARSLIAFKPYCDDLVFIVSDMTNAGVNVEEQHLNMGYFLSALPIKHLITIGEYSKLIAKGASLIRSHNKQIYSVNTIDEMLDILSEILDKKAVLSLKGVGKVATHRVMKYLSEKDT